MIKKLSKKIIIHAILLIFALICIFPFYWMIITALKSPADVMEFPPKIYPVSFEFKNFARVFQLMPMGMAFLISIKVTLLTTLGTLLTSSLAAFAFAKMKFKYKGVLFAVLLGTMMIPTQVTLIPLYIVFGKMNWVDTHLPLIIPAILTNAYGVFMIRQFMVSLPNEYIESAQIDGYGYLSIYSKIMMPLSKPILVTLGLFTFIWTWNDYLKPLIFLNTESKFTVPLIISSFRGVYEVQWELLMAASTVAVIPIILLYLFSQKYFVEAITMTGIKG